MFILLFQSDGYVTIFLHVSIVMIRLRFTCSYIMDLLCSSYVILFWIMFEL